MAHLTSLLLGRETEDLLTDGMETELRCGERGEVAAVSHNSRLVVRQHDECLFSPFVVIGPLSLWVAIDHALIEGTGFGNTVLHSQDLCGMDRTGGAERERIDGSAERLSHHLASP